MKLTNGEVWAMVQGLNKVANKELPWKESLTVLRNLQALKPEAESIEKVRLGIIEKHGTKNKKGVHEVKQEDVCWPEFVSEINSMFAEEIEVEVKQFSLPANVDLEATTIESIEKLLVL